MRAGDGVFETLRMVDGVPFALTRHLERMAASSAALGLPTVTVDEVRDQVLRELAVDGGEVAGAARLRLLWSGAGLQVAHSPLPPGGGAMRVRTSSWRRNRAAGTAGHKSTDYVDNLVALREAVTAGADEVLLADTAGMLSEGSATNVFYVVGGELRTPSLATGCLPGITRGLVLEWTGAREVEEPLDVLGEAEEVFLTSSTREVEGVAWCDAWAYAAPGPVTADVIRTFAARRDAHPDP
ncbi:aminotransferase class IV [Nocardioides jishulii]|uniref:4-amino-4-deoxychorismate lyase n=1 Tax=Nocardioides jishulii TaxID=2575440 RepID=A0A4U2YNJ6_9ACTN|nr:aminotransferase class IV [Nocardioides jishulii]QCX27744.1 4-amino-4-deoxychorismate lyase [Nocardioides jishulii]TKI62550.1 4-amino-4-deoxychorismate lyase [Nocardioides jishulii]